MSETAEAVAAKPAHHEHHAHLHAIGTRCKMTCQGKKDAYGGGAEVILTPVYDSDPASVNHSFWTATPSGYVQLFISNPTGAELFQVGKAYYVDFTPAE